LAPLLKEERHRLCGGRTELLKDVLNLVFEIGINALSDHG
jgi:hypothetical protein